MTTIEDIYHQIKQSSANTCRPFAILKLVPENAGILEMYQEKVYYHNVNIVKNLFADAGFDIFVPTTTLFDKAFETKFIDHKIKAEMVYCDVDTDSLTTSAFVMHPRSSISKTPLMLANHTGIIDSGYRGSLIGAFRCLDSLPYTVESSTRLLQICHPTLCPIYVTICKEDELTTTERGHGGFGSTGK